MQYDLWVLLLTLPIQEPDMGAQSASHPCGVHTMLQSQWGDLPAAHAYNNWWTTWCHQGLHPDSAGMLLAGVKTGVVLVHPANHGDHSSSIGEAVVSHALTLVLSVPFHCLMVNTVLPALQYHQPLYHATYPHCTSTGSSWGSLLRSHQWGLWCTSHHHNDEEVDGPQPATDIPPCSASCTRTGHSTGGRCPHWWNQGQVWDLNSFPSLG